MTFILTGIFGALWLVAWLAMYRDDPATHKNVGEAELAYITQDPADPEVKTPGLWLRLLAQRETWAFALGKFFIDPIWWFYLFWLPKFLATEHGIRGTAIIPYLTTVYVISDVGSIFGGYLSSAMIKAGWSVNRARKTTFLIFAAVVPTVIIASQTKSAWTAVLLIGLATACHQGWSANLYTIASDMFPRRAVGTVIGFGGFMGGIGGILIAEFAGRVLNANPSYYLPMFVVAGLAYLVALAVMHTLAPRLEPAHMAE
jgi:ACS family hexuronate transporter-like MFS transporter